jgi:prepilin-type N-terminal cleavage/methylation domain-containing protein
MRRRGFTLVEMMTTVGIASMLGAMAVSHFSHTRRRAEETQLRADLYQLRSALDRAFADTGLYPYTLAELASATPPDEGLRPYGSDPRNNGDRNLIGARWRGPYIKAIPLDPTYGQTYQYFSEAACPNNATVCSRSTLLSSEGTVLNTW